jgi:hypothetical protein
MYHIFEVSCPIGKIFMSMGEPNEDLQYFLDFQKQRRKNKMSLFKGKKNI